MNLLNVLTTVYGKLHNYPGIPFWLLTPFRKIVRSIANVVLPAYLERKHKVFLLNGHGVIVSFTSFPARIQDVWKVVESLKNQTICPDKILLWLSKDQFPSKENVPHRLIECEDDLFEIRMVDGNIRSHKKYFYAMREFPRSTIITCDDDIYYHPKMLESLIKTGKKYPGCIIANVTKQMLFDGNGDLLPYYKWNGDFKPFSSLNNVQIGAGGVLYPPGSLHKFVLKKDLFSKLAPLADDLWLNCMARLQKTPVIQTDFNVLPLGIESLAPSLSSVNNGQEDMNDKQISQMSDWLKTDNLQNVFHKSYIVEYQNGGGQIIVSLTSFPERINQVWQVVTCMLNQTMMPHKIILWLSKDQFPTQNTIPENLKQIENSIFHIRLVDGDIRSHKKYYYAIKEYPNNLIFLIDDDLYYPANIIERSYRQYEKTKGIISNYGYKIEFDVSGKHKCYSDWKYVYQGASGHDLFFGSGGGTLFKPAMLSDKVTNIDLALEVTPYADDVWLNAMAKIKRSTVQILPFGEILPIRTDSQTLSSKNNGLRQNDVQIANVERLFGRCFDKFQTGF